MSSLKNERGFSLIELMITVAIIGILATMSVSSFQQFTYRARIQEYVSQTSGMKPYIEGIRAEVDTYPATGWVSRQVGSAWYAPSFADPALDSIMNLLPLAPPERNDCPSPEGYAYLYASNGTDYKVIAHCMTNKKNRDGTYMTVESQLTDPLRTCPTTTCPTQYWGCGGYYIWAIGNWSPGARCSM